MRIDTTGNTWLVISAYLTDRLAACREKNDGPKNTEAETAALRGEIAAIKDLLALPSQEARVIQDDPGYSTESLDDD